MSSPPPATACGPKVAAHEPEIVRHERVWGPVPSDRTEARHAASSVLIRPHDVQLERCRKNVLAEVPAGVLPMADDTPKTLSSHWVIRPTAVISQKTCSEQGLGAASQDKFLPTQAETAGGR